MKVVKLKYLRANSVKATKNVVNVFGAWKALTNAVCDHGYRCKVEIVCAGVFLLTWLLNIRRVQKIGVVDQFIMSYGGIRGAVCYGLVMSLNGQVTIASATCVYVKYMFSLVYTIV